MLTRQAIDSGAYLENFETLPNLWTKAQIERSLEETLALRPDDARELWVFAYGSLMWNPLV
jgi:cation transport protein ChaC